MADSYLRAPAKTDGFHQFDGSIPSSQRVPGFEEDYPSGFGQTNCLCASFAELYSDRSLQVSDLTAQGRLGDVKPNRRAGDILSSGDSDEIAQVA